MALRTAVRTAVQFSLSSPTLTLDALTIVLDLAAKPGGTDTVSDSASPEAMFRQLDPVALTTFPADKYQSTSVLESFFLAMTLYPDVYEKGKRSIDEVVGTDRLDRKSVV